MAAFRDIAERAVVVLEDLDDVAAGYSTCERLGELERVQVWKQLAQAFLNGCRLAQLAEAGEDVRRLRTRSSTAPLGRPNEVAENEVAYCGTIRHRSTLRMGPILRDRPGGVTGQRSCSLHLRRIVRTASTSDHTAGRRDTRAAYG
jgi:hypothetical protein